jgi:hypothetical protein
MSKLDLTDLATGGITPSYVSVDIAAALMGVSHWTVRRWSGTADRPSGRRRRSLRPCGAGNPNQRRTPHRE